MLVSCQVQALDDVSSCVGVERLCSIPCWWAPLGALLAPFVAPRAPFVARLSVELVRFANPHAELLLATLVILVADRAGLLLAPFQCRQSCSAMPVP